MEKSSIPIEIWQKAQYVSILLFLLNTHIFAGTRSGMVTDKVNWKEFLSRHDLIWERMPDDYFAAPFLGNGLLGALLYAPEGEKLRLDIGRADVVEHRNSNANSIVDNGRLPIGHFTLEMNYPFSNANGRLDLYNAETGLNITVPEKGDMTLKTLVFRDYNAIMVEMEVPLGLQCYWMYHPDASIVFRNPKVGKRYLNPLPEWSFIDGIHVCTQKRDAGGSYTIAWKITKIFGGKTRLFVTIQDSYPGKESVELAVEKIKEISIPEKTDEEIKKHRAWWNDFYTRSFISVPHTRMESVYWIQQYKFASMMREEGPLCDLMGPWYKQTSWPGIWWNLNTQMLYSSLHISNQLKLASTLPDYLIKMNDKLIAAAPEKWQYNSAGVSRCTGPDMDESTLTWPSSEAPERSNLTYLCYYLWEYYRVSMDEDYLKNHFFPLLRRSVNLMLHEVYTDENGIVHTPYGHSPESTEATDTNYDLSSLKWGCQTLLKINKQLHLKDSLELKWQYVVDHLLPFPVDENGYMCSAQLSAPLMHRHWCHLFQIYPYYLTNWDQPQNREVILRSLKYWGSPAIPNTWTQAVISSMYSSVKDGENALKHLNLALASPNFYPNTFHAEGRNPCSETYGGLCRMLLDMLIQSWGDKIRIFPGVPDSWKDVVFHNLRAEGGFEVSAKKENGKVVWVRVKNNTGELCIIEPEFNGTFKISGGKIKKASESTFVLNIEKGKEMILYTKNTADLKIEPVETEEKQYNFYGLKKK